jgi:CPA2 family monovalent cation:H+ antiporter-2
MTHETFLWNVAAALVAALLGGLAARLLRIPVLIGYLVMGVIVGHHTPGFNADEATVQEVAKVGAALLMFAVGVQLSIKDMVAVQRTALGGGAIHIIGSILIGIGLGAAFGWDLFSSVFLGCALAMSSTTIIMRVLEERGEVGEGQAPVMLGISVVQDVSIVAMVAILPALSAGSKGLAGDVWGHVALAVLSAVFFVAVALYAALKLVPFLLGAVAKTGVRELFVLAVVCLCFAAAYGAYQAGLSLEVGAFLAGLTISESRFRHEVLAQVRPLRDLFASLFFVSIGMLMDPTFILQNAGIVAVVVMAMVVGQFVITGIAVYAFGWHGRVAILAALGLAQIGEFSFVLTAFGMDRRLIGPEVSGVILSTALISILLVPFLYAAGRPIYNWLCKNPTWFNLLNRHTVETAHPTEDYRPMVVILGSGRIGRHISDTLLVEDVPQLVVDYEKKVLDHRRKRGVPTLFGDASSEDLLEQTHPETAKLVVVTLPDAGATEAAVRALKRLAPDTMVLARVHRGENIRELRQAGADIVVHAEFEASMRLVRDTMTLLGFPEEETDARINELRRGRYPGGIGTGAGHEVAEDAGGTTSG